MYLSRRNSRFYLIVLMEYPINMIAKGELQWLTSTDFHLSSIASSGHCNTQAPQAMHFSES